jgi:archaellum component FlaC
MRSDDVLSRLETVLTRLERMSVEHKVVDPKREQEVDALLDETREAVREIQAWKRQQETDERLAEVLEAIAKSTSTANERLETSEERLGHVENALEKRDRLPFKVDPEIDAEGTWLKARLAGPLVTTTHANLLKDGRREKVDSGLDLLRSELLEPADDRSD